MRPFEYVSPATEAEAVEALNGHDGQTMVLAGGTDLISLLQRDAVQTQRVVDIKKINTLKSIEQVDDGVLIGATVTLDEALESPLLAGHDSIAQVIDGHRAIQIQSSGTLVGDLCQMPQCWYFRNGFGVLGRKDGESLAELGDNRYHAVFGNAGPAKFVCASRFAPSMVAWGAKVRVIGPTPEDEQFVPLEYFFVTPRLESQGVNVLKPGQLVTHIWLQTVADMKSGAYEVLESKGLDRPQAAAAVCLKTEGDFIRDARIVLGHVAPTPWIAHEAARALVGQRLDEDMAGHIGDLAVSKATPLSMNEYKVAMARAAVKRSLLRAVGKLDAALV
ncbi:MAG: FAD binding domain-containing protein [Rhodopirellula sp.]|nr:FAD binding domain-containing protein [Rhodopirellula sp.]